MADNKSKTLVWVRDNSRYAHGSLYRLEGERNITFACTTRAIGNKSEPNAPLWGVEMRLPGIRLKPDANGNSPRFHTEAEAKANAERAVAVWFKWVEGIKL